MHVHVGLDFKPNMIVLVCILYGRSGMMLLLLELQIPCIATQLLAESQAQGVVATLAHRFLVHTSALASGK